MSQKLPVNNFEWIEDTSQFNEDFIKNYNEESDEGYFLERMNIEKVEKLIASLQDKAEKQIIFIKTLQLNLIINKFSRKK